jgi:hypothetical protein
VPKSARQVRKAFDIAVLQFIAVYLLNLPAGVSCNIVTVPEVSKKLTVKVIVVKRTFPSVPLVAINFLRPLNQTVD